MKHMKYYIYDRGDISFPFRGKTGWYDKDYQHLSEILPYDSYEEARQYIQDAPYVLDISFSRILRRSEIKRLSVISESELIIIML